jgi:hypothetical protein
MEKEKKKERKKRKKEEEGRRGNKRANESQCVAKKRVLNSLLTFLKSLGKGFIVEKRRMKGRK